MPLFNPGGVISGTDVVVVVSSGWNLWTYLPVWCVFVPQPSHTIKHINQCTDSGEKGNELGGWPGKIVAQFGSANECPLITKPHGDPGCHVRQQG